MDMIMDYLPFLIPIAVIELGLEIAALVHLLTHKKYRFGNRILWVIIVIVFGFIGPVAYLTIGRGEE